jgi:hypothetical protein
MLRVPLHDPRDTLGMDKVESFHLAVLAAIFIAAR